MVPEINPSRRGGKEAQKSSIRVSLCVPIVSSVVADRAGKKKLQTPEDRLDFCGLN